MNINCDGNEYYVYLDECETCSLHGNCAKEEMAMECRKEAKQNG